MAQKLTQEDFIKKAKEIHEEKYDYSKVKYCDQKSKVCIICPKHGEFWITPNNHTNKTHPQGCKHCGVEKRNNSQRKTTEEFIEQANIVHNNKYLYDDVIYNNNQEHITIICPVHGRFKIRPVDHLRGKGCRQCANILLKEKHLMSVDEFIKKCDEKFGNKFTIKTDGYIGQESVVEVECPYHGLFNIKAKYFIKNKFGCPQCAKDERCLKKRKELNAFINESNEIHNRKYDYSKVEYKNNRTKVCIICPEHGEFQQTPIKHLAGQGCPRCSNSKMEQTVEKLLRERKIKYVDHFRSAWLGKQHIDFYLIDYNIAIECQGEQHYIPVDFAGKGVEWAKCRLIETQAQDNRKRKLCENNDIKLYYIAYNDDVENVLNKILNKQIVN